MRYRERKKEKSEEPVQSLDRIVKGGEGESNITKTQRQLKMSLNDEIRLKMQERLRIMRESDSEEETGVNEMDLSVCWKFPW